MTKKMKNYIALFVVNKENSKNLYQTSQKKASVLSIICSKCKNKDEKLFKEEKSNEILKIIGLIESI